MKCAVWKGKEQFMIALQGSGSRGSHLGTQTLKTSSGQNIHERLIMMSWAKLFKRITTTLLALGACQFLSTLFKAPWFSICTSSDSTADSLDFTVKMGHTFDLL